MRVRGILGIGEHLRVNSLLYHFIDGLLSTAFNQNSWTWLSVLASALSAPSSSSTTNSKSHQTSGYPVLISIWRLVFFCLYPCYECVVFAICLALVLDVKMISINSVFRDDVMTDICSSSVNPGRLTPFSETGLISRHSSFYQSRI